MKPPLIIVYFVVLLNVKLNAKLCPKANPACIYQARALYNSIYRLPIAFNDCGESSSRMAATEKSESIEERIWDVDLFPNPTQTQLNVINKNESEILNVVITDLSGRIVLAQNLASKNKLASLKIDLPNGAYFIAINNSDNEKVIKKLLISK